MNLKTIKLDANSYQEYLAGKEVACEATQLTTKNLQEGERVMVFKDTIATNADVAVPKREMQSEYIGVEGQVTSVRMAGAEHTDIRIRKI
jgi:hypothetical protein